MFYKHDPVSNHPFDVSITTMQLKKPMIQKQNPNFNVFWVKIKSWTSTQISGFAFRLPHNPRDKQLSKLLSYTTSDLPFQVTEASMPKRFRPRATSATSRLPLLSLSMALKKLRPSVTRILQTKFRLGCRKRNG